MAGECSFPELTLCADMIIRHHHFIYKFLPLLTRWAHTHTHTHTHTQSETRGAKDRSKREYEFVVSPNATCYYCVTSVQHRTNKCRLSYPCSVWTCITHNLATALSSSLIERGSNPRLLLPLLGNQRSALTSELHSLLLKAFHTTQDKYSQHLHL